jgi:hypothetical protein
MRRKPITILVLASALLTGCARDAFIVQTGLGFTEAGQPVTAEANRVLTEVERGSRASMIAIVVRDPSCDWPELRIARSSGRPDQPLCAAKADDTLVTVRQLTATDFQPTLALLSAYANYVEAVQAIVSEQPFDSDAALDSARADLQAVGGDIATLAGADPPAFLKDDQFAAVRTLVKLVVELRTERDKARRQQLVQAQAPDVEALTRTLGQDIDRWTELGLVSDLSNLQTAQRIEWNRSRQSAVPAERQRMLDEQIAVAEQIAAARALPVGLRRMLAETDAAYDLYLQALGQRELTPEARRQLAAIAQARWRMALKAVLRTLASFAPGA